MKKTKNIPTTDINGNPLKFEFGKSTFDDIQTGVLQELPEMAPAGLLPRSVNIVLQHDLVDKVKPGDRVQLIGIYRLHPNYQSK
jgi:DNA replication licensing factor MCM3